MESLMLIRFIWIFKKERERHAVIIYVCMCVKGSLRNTFHCRSRVLWFRGNVRNFARSRGKDLAIGSSIWPVKAKNSKPEIH